MIESGTHIRGALSYNENKVACGKADCIGAVNYPLEHKEMSFMQKLKRLTNQAALRERVEHKCLHLSLNFDPSEQFTDERLNEIAGSYMEKLGFGDQPYLVYHHKDSAHPHVHIVSVTINELGERIPLNDIVVRKSEPARKSVEEEFNLVRAQGRNQKSLGILGTKSDITNIVRLVFKQYKFTSFEEYSTILEQFGIIADRGAPETLMFKNGGLQYLKRGSEGNSKPIKASSIFGQPTLKKIESKYAKNELLRQKFKGRLCRIIDDLLNKNRNLEEFKEGLTKYKINLQLRINASGYIDDITYIDNQTLCIFNGSNLYKRFTVERVLQRFNHTADLKSNIESKVNSVARKDILARKVNKKLPLKERKFYPSSYRIGDSTYLPFQQISFGHGIFYLNNIITELLETPIPNDHISSELLKEAKKKAKRRKR